MKCSVLEDFLHACVPISQVEQAVLTEAAAHIEQNAVGPVNIQTAASEFWGKRIHQTCARIPKKCLKRANM
jgi:hypothetical protein